MKLKHIYISVALACVSVVLFTAFTMSARLTASGSDEPQSKIKFSHKLHKDATDCVSCHTGIKESGSLNAGLFPKMEDCSSCHDVKDEKSCSLCHKTRAKSAIEFTNEDYRFTHKLHLSKGMECLTCHKGIDESEYLAEGQHFNPDMKLCSTCHTDLGKAPGNCETCHLTMANLKPESHLVDNYLRTHKFQASKKNADCNMCHTSSSCEDCHAVSNSIGEANTATDFVTPYAPSQSTSGTNQQKITRVHDLNFRYSHGIEAKSKTMECSTCHQNTTFCASCHSSSSRHEDFAMSGIKPMSHTPVTTFVNVAKGSGGGEHSKLARRDIESCASCHDVNGGDPVCLNCHTDATGIKGTGNKTHGSGFAKSMGHGDWHNTTSSVCYNCHVDGNARPDGVPSQGFCGYCHPNKVRRG